jgi:uncharacterized protein YegP (UPF0339 family)
MRFVIYEDDAGRYRWRLVWDNGNIGADSGYGYTRRRDARRAAQRVREQFTSSNVRIEDE